MAGTHPEDGGPTADTGGSAGAGGDDDAAATGGTGGGGAAGTAGDGAAGAGGAAGDAGATSDGGGGTTEAGAGGAGGGGGAGGALAGALATFDTTDEGFVLSQTDVPANLTRHNAGTAPTLAWDGTQGNPAPGSLKATAPYSAYNQYIDVQKNYATTALANWTGKTKLHVRLKVASGFNPDPRAPGLAALYATTYAAPDDGGAAATHVKGVSIEIAPGSDWQELILNMEAINVVGWDPAKVISFGVQLSTGTGMVTGADAGAPPGPPTPAVFYIDSFVLD